MRGFNHVTLGGNMTHDPKLHGSDGREVLTVSLAINSREKKGDAWHDRVDYVDVTALGADARNIAAFKKKGDPLLVHGRLYLKRWPGQDGAERRQLCVLAREVNFLPTGRNAHAGQSSTAEQVREAFPDAQPVDEQGIPF